MRPLLFKTNVFLSFLFFPRSVLTNTPTSSQSSSASATASPSAWPSSSASVSTSSIPAASASPVTNLGPSRTPSSTKTFGFLNVSDCFVTNSSFYKDGIVSYAVTTAPGCLNTTKGPIIVEITLGSLANVLLQPYALACFSIVLLFVFLICYRWLRYKRQQIEEIVEQSYLEKTAKDLSEKAKKRRKDENDKFLMKNFASPIPEFSREHLAKVAKSMGADFSLEPRVEASKLSRMNALSFVSKRSVASSGKRLIKVADDIALTEGNQIKVNNPLRSFHQGYGEDPTLFNLGSLVTQSSGMASLQEIAAHRSQYNKPFKFIQVVEKTLEADEELKNNKTDGEEDDDKDDDDDDNDGKGDVKVGNKMEEEEDIDENDNDQEEEDDR